MMLTGAAQRGWVARIYLAAPRGTLRRAGVDILRRPGACAATTVIGAVAVLAVCAPLLTHLGFLANPERIDAHALNAAPGGRHLLGTDNLGRDLLSRVIYGARASLSLAVLVQAVSLVIAGVVGIAAGYSRGKVDTALMRVTDLMFAFPDLLFVLVVLAVMGPGYVNLLIVMAVVSWPFLARLVRAQTLAVRHSGYVEAARCTGTRTRTIVIRHVVPNAIGPVLVTALFGIPSIIFMEAFLSFVGLGIRPPAASWGVMLNDGYQAVLAYPYQVLVPAGAIALVSFCFNHLADTLRDVLDPRMGDLR